MIRDSKRARELGSKGGKARAQNRLTLARVEAELPPLDSLENAMLRLDKVGLWCAGGLLSGAVGGAIVRSVEVWIKAHESRLTRKVAEDLMRRVDELYAQLGKGGGTQQPQLRKAH